MSRRVYVDHPADAPAWAVVREGRRGGLYYELSYEGLPDSLLGVIGEMAAEIRQVVRDSVQEAVVALDSDEMEFVFDEAASYAEPVIRSELERRVDADIDPAVFEEIAGVVVDEFLDRYGDAVLGDVV